VASPALPANNLPRSLRPGRINWWGTTPIWVIHALPLLAFVTGVPWWNWVLMVGLFFGRMFFITAGYHRYFAHRSYRTNRVFQFLLALGGATAAQKGPLWWAGNHRLHHRYADTERDIHSPIAGFWWSHIGWILSDAHDETPTRDIEDFAKYPELRFLNRHDWIAPWALGVTVWFFAGWSGLLIGFFLSTVLLWHATFTVNSIAHVVGNRRYVTTDTSRNNLAIALLTMGEGWHNNHHYYPASARQGFFWWEVDVTYYVLVALSWVGLVKDLRTPSQEVRRACRVKDGNLDVGMLRDALRNAAVVVDRSRLPTLDVDQPELDAAKTRLEESLDEVAAAAKHVARLDRKRRRDTAVAAKP
jgi:stearoyl-CoA desaturase (delta-9 desaturase)